MKLFKYEMKKLLINKNRLILLAILFVIYTLLSIVFSIGSEFELAGEMRANAVNEYESLVLENTGRLNTDQLQESRRIVEEAIEKYGRGEPLSYHLNRDTVLKFHFRYSVFGQRVDEYWNGPEEYKGTNIIGINPLREKLSALEDSGETDTYEYRYYQKRLEKELAIGEPVFEDLAVWNHFFIMFDSMLIILLLLMVLTYFISPLFTQEIKTEMDNIILCSVKGRREIVTAKLMSAALTSGILASVYLLASFIGMFMGGQGSLSGFDAPARCLEGFQYTMLNMTVGEVALLESAWLILATIVFGLALSLISSLMKNHSAAFGLGIVILLSGIMTDALSDKIKALLWPVVDFNFGKLALFMNIFGGTKAYNILGAPVSYGLVAFLICLVLSAMACILTYIAQRKRAVV
jgi:hypothetical protein